MKYKKLESTKNPAVAEALEIRDRRSRFRNDAFIIEGPHLIEEALKERAALKRVFYTNSFTEKHARLFGLLEGSGAEMLEASDRIIARISEAETPQGVAAIASINTASLDEVKAEGIMVVMDGIQDPGNVGTIIRTSDAAGADAVVLLPGTCDPFMPKALRASAGSIFHMPLIYESRETLIEKLKAKGVRLITTEAGARLSLFDADLSLPLAFVFGNEAAGVSPELRSAADLKVRIPMPGRAESLSVAASAAVCLYEALRKRGL